MLSILFKLITIIHTRKKNKNCDHRKNECSDWYEKLQIPIFLVSLSEWIFVQLDLLNFEVFVSRMEYVHPTCAIKQCRTRYA